MLNTKLYPPALCLLWWQDFSLASLKTAKSLMEILVISPENLMHKIDDYYYFDFFAILIFCSLSLFLKIFDLTSDLKTNHYFFTSKIFCFLWRHAITWKLFYGLRMNFKPESCKNFILFISGLFCQKNIFIF